MSDIVKATLALDPHSLTYQVQMTPDEAREYVEGLPPSYNGWTRAGALRLLDAVNGLIPPMQFNEGNPNNGHPHHKFKVGREGSRVLYVWVAKAYLPDDYNYERLDALLADAGRDAQADEITCQDDTEHGYEFRFWWD